MEFVRETAAAAVHLRARQRRAGHLRPRLGPAARRRAAAAADRRGAGARRARQPVHGRRCRRRWPRPRARRRRPRRALHRAATRGPRHAAAGRRCSPRFAAAARAAQAAGLGVNAGHDLNRANLGDFLRAVPGVLEVSIGHAFDRRRARARHGRDGARLRRRARPVGAALRPRWSTASAPTSATSAASRATLARRGDRFAERVLGPHELAGVPRPPRAARGARRALPGDALLRQGGVLQGDRPGHAHADDLARLRDRQRCRAASPRSACTACSPSGSRRAACAPMSP